MIELLMTGAILFFFATTIASIIGIFFFGLKYALRRRVDKFLSGFWEKEEFDFFRNVALCALVFGVSVAAAEFLAYYHLD